MKDVDPAPRLSASLTLSGKRFDFDECTRSIGLRPVAVWHPPSKSLNKSLDLPDAAWSCGFEKSPLYSVDDALRELLSTVWPKRIPIKECAEEKGLQISVDCNITIHEDRPIYELSPETMSKLVWFGADFGMDIFDYSEDD